MFPRFPAHGPQILVHLCLRFEIKKQGGTLAVFHSCKQILLCLVHCSIMFGSFWEGYPPLDPLGTWRGAGMIFHGFATFLNTFLGGPGVSFSVLFVILLVVFLLAASPPWEVFIGTWAPCGEHCGDF